VDSQTPESRSRDLLERAEELAQIGSWEWRPGPDELVFSANMFRLYGFEPGDAAAPCPELMERIHPDDVEAVVRRYEEVMSWRTPRVVEYRTFRADGGVRHLRSTVTAVDGNGDRPSRMVGVVQDITEQRQAEREIAAHIAVSDALAEWESIEVSGEGLLSKFAGAMGFDGGVLWVPKEGALVARVVWLAGSVDSPEVRRDLSRARLPRGSGIAGRAWMAREPVIATNVHEESNYVFRNAVTMQSVRGAFAVPVLTRTDVLAVLGFASRDETQLTDRLTRSLVGIGYEVGHFFSRRRAELEPGSLTPREVEVLQLAARRHSGPEIAKRLVVSPSTIKTHFENIYEKLGVSDRTSAVAEALRQGLID
jgi:DNA-binding NarL/FixJ family response regulator